MTLRRFGPFAEAVALREAMNRLLEESPWEGRVQDFAIDVCETDEAFTVEAELPGMKSEDIDISVEGSTLSIQGEKKEKRESKEEHYHRRETRFGRFSRSLTLPSTVDRDRATAKFEDGVLIVTLPKAEATRPKRIDVSP